jgi:hypothetical protein
MEIHEDYLTAAPFINTPLQRGVGTCERTVTRFSGLFRTQETAEAVQPVTGRCSTPLKRGVNEITSTAAGWRLCHQASFSQLAAVHQNSSARVSSQSWLGAGRSGRPSPYCVNFTEPVTNGINNDGVYPNRLLVTGTLCTGAHSGVSRNQ